MPTRDDVKRAVCEAIDRQSEKIVAVGDTIRKNPELGFKEFKTSRLVEDTMREIGLQPKGGLAITGVRGEARGKKDGPTFALLGELDGLVVAGHPVADSQTGAAHACGHNASAPRPSSTWPGGWSSSPSPPRSTVTSPGASSRRGQGSSSSWAASPSCSASATSTTSTWR